MQLSAYILRTQAKPQDILQPPHLSIRSVIHPDPSPIEFYSAAQPEWLKIELYVII